MTTTSQLHRYLKVLGLEEKTLQVGEGTYRGIYATRPFRAGEDVFPKGEQQQPMASVLCHEERQERCGECLRLGNDSLQRCGGCRQVWYCGVGCQRRAWKEHHGVMCRGPLAELEMSGPSKTEGELVRRTMLALERPDDSRREWPGLEKEAFLRLDTHWEAQGSQERTEARALARWIMATRALGSSSTMGTTGSSEEEEEIMGHVFRLRSSAFAPADLQCFPYAAMSSYPARGALLNHSCRPTSVALWDGGNGQVVRVMEDMEVGEEMTLSYVDPCLNGPDRRKALGLQYHFTCECSRCLEEKEGETGVNGNGALTKKGIQEMSEMISKDDDLLNGLYMVWSREHFEDWRRETVQRVCRISRGEGSEVLFLVSRWVPGWTREFERALDDSEWEVALTYALLLLLIYLLIYPRRHPIVLLQWLTVCKCATQMARGMGREYDRGKILSLALRSLHLVQSSLPISLCEADPEVRELRRQVQGLAEDLDDLSTGS
ncbi:hypothetical protein BJ684DRAFT_15780 [Piptocephalis cylindrospora]|uniref:MYND-type domain-containing protein n=1 Tax=Piptocephalis cylindrospora TaxID=1907219 RepID=A0A4P9Y4J3_9FUNG|nr:hypothetical protein BJ684DRAFT_15780 [Piptocephalis cylindrospora]|eukprot:RKP13857.1 hypothetical protein BJ684DRAFT_15780 [Piptocephalis cylindrospora]